MSSTVTKPVDEVREELLRNSMGLAKRVQQLSRLLGILWWGLFVVATLVALMLLDFLLRREELGMRLLSLGVWLGAMGWAGWRFLIPVWRLSPTPLQMARWIERSRPDLGERLSTAVQIAATEPSDDRFGSLAFREAVLINWRDESHKPTWNSYVDKSRLWRVLLLVAVMLLGCAGAIAVSPIDSQLAMNRFFQPWSAPAWPRRDQLEFVDLPEVAAIGSEIQVEVRDRNAPLPVDVIVQVRIAGEALDRVVELPAKGLEDIAVANLPPLEQPIEVRAMGGDDLNMAWQRIDVVAPPKLESYQFVIEPPGYSRRTKSELIGTRIQVLAGSKVLFKGQFDKTIRSAQLIPIEWEAASNASGETDRSITSEMVVRLDAGDSHSITIGSEDGQALELTHSTAWRLQVETLDGLQIELPQRWTVEVVDDAPPTAVILTPSLEQLTSSGQVRVAGSGSDDVGLELLSVKAQVDGAAYEAVGLNLWASEGELSQDVTVDETWDVSTMLANANQPLEVGQVLMVWLEATDQLGQIGRSQIERLEIKSPEAVASALMERQEKVLTQLREMVSVQRRSQQMTERTEQQLRMSETITQADIDTLNGVAQSQTALAGQLSGQQDSLLEQTAEIERLLQLNRLETGAAANQIQQLQQDLQAIASGEMEQATTAAATAHRQAADLLAENRASDVSPTIEGLAESSQAQSDVLRKMEDLADRLNHSGGLQQVQREMAALAGRQAMLLEETEALQLEQLKNGRPDALEAARRAVAADQQSLAQQLDGLLDRARELTAGSPDGNEPLTNAIQQATSALGDSQTSRLMHQAADEIDDADLTDALESQQQVVANLVKAMQGLEPTGQISASDSMAVQAENLRTRQDAISSLADAQQRLAEDLGQATASQADRLAQQQSELAEASRQQSQLAEQQGDGSASELLDSAAESQDDARQAAEQQEMESAADAARQAADKLSQLAQQLSDRANELDRQSQLQQLLRLTDSLQSLVDQQQPVVASIESLAGQLHDVSNSNVEAPTLDEPLARDLAEPMAREIAARQEAIRQRLLEIRQQVGELPAFDWTLDQTSQDMAKAVAAAERFRIAPDARMAANDALRKLELTLSAVQSATQQPSEENDQQSEEQNNDEPQDSDEQKSSAFPPLASLKLLRGLQQELNAQTRQFDDELDASRKHRRLDELSQQQQELGKQIESLLREMQGDAASPK